MSNLRFIPFIVWLKRHHKTKKKKRKISKKKKKKKRKISKKKVRSFKRKISKKKVRSFYSHLKDEYYTPESAFKILQPYIQHMKGKTVWEAFGKDFNKIRSPIYIRRMGFKVIANGRDFWKQEKGDFVISNPPYQNVPGKKNTKERIIKRLCGICMPFCLLLPTSFIQTKSFRNLVKQYGKFQLIMPSGRIQFYTIEAGKKITRGRCSFYTCWVCWNMGLVSDLILSDIN